MLAALYERLSKLMEVYPEMSMQKQDYDEERNAPFILAIVTPLMKRVHLMVSLKGYWQQKNLLLYLKEHEKISQLPV